MTKPVTKYEQMILDHTDEPLDKKTADAIKDVVDVEKGFNTQWLNIYGQYLDKTADAIQNRVDDGQIVFYFLKDYELKGLEFETILEVDGRIEITLREIDSDEGGNHD